MRRERFSFPLSGDAIVQRGHVEVRARRVGGTAGRVRWVTASFLRETWHVALVHYQQGTAIEKNRFNIQISQL